MHIARRKTRQITVGSLKIGGDAPVSVQSMCSTDTRDVAATVEQIGHYNPTKNPAEVKLDKARVEYWVGKGAQMTPTVKSLFKRA